ncbi:hypothetical protein HDU67_007100 [Dinochytrium kinnereticum]|nr:hypothetical protein HDU67_007100 [Dinochytrium kinnereticum]
MGSQTRFTVSAAGVMDSCASLADLEVELKKLDGGDEDMRLFDVDWMPSYVGECSLEGNNLFGTFDLSTSTTFLNYMSSDDTLVVAITDSHLYVAEPKKKRGDYPTLLKKIRLNEIVGIEQQNINIGFDWAFPHISISYQEMVKVRPPGKKIPKDRFSLDHQVGE